MSGKSDAVFLLSLVLLFTCAFAGIFVSPKKSDYTYIYRSWPQLTGNSVEDVKVKITRDMPKIRFWVGSASQGIISFILPQVVFLFENENGTVVNLPETLQKIKLDFKRWPEAVGLTADEATDIILRDKPEARIEVIVDGSPVSEDFWLRRVRVFVNTDRVVVKVPYTG